jgi:hypothetical protein
MKKLRFDLVFSYWIFLWYILYVFNIVIYSPKFLLIIGLIYNIIMLFFMFIYRTNKTTIFYFILINTFIKVLPLYYLKNKLIKISDIYFSILLFCLFILWLHINKQSLLGNTKIIHDSLLYGNNKTPFIVLLNKIKTNFKNFKI